MEPKSKHNVDTVIDLFDRLLAERDKRYQERFDSQEKALAKAEQSLSDYKASANEIRAALNDYQKNTMPRIETETRFSSIDKLIKVLELSEGRGEGVSFATARSREQSNFMKTLIVSIVGMVIGNAITIIIFFYTLFRKTP